MINAAGPTQLGDCKNSGASSAAPSDTGIEASDLDIPATNTEESTRRELCSSMDRPVWPKARSDAADSTQEGLLANAEDPERAKSRAGNRKSSMASPDVSADEPARAKTLKESAEPNSPCWEAEAAGSV